MPLHQIQINMKRNLIAWVEIPALDFERAVRFYSRVFGLELSALDCGNEKMACFPGGEGAVSLAQGFNPSADGVMVSLHTGDELEATISRIMENGGKILRGKTKIEAEGRGYFAVFTDCEGNRLGLYGDK